MRRKIFKALAANIAESLSYRNNDYLGYWAVGQLYSLAIKNKTERVSIDPFEGKTIPYAPYFDRLSEICRDRINDKISKMGINIAEISSIKIDYRFEINMEEERGKVKGYRLGYMRFGFGNPYIASVSVVGLSNIVYKHSVGGFCVPHNPLKEQRRGGYS